MQIYSNFSLSKPAYVRIENGYSGKGIVKGDSVAFPEPDTGEVEHRTQQTRLKALCDLVGIHDNLGGHVQSYRPVRTHRRVEHDRGCVRIDQGIPLCKG